jgi:glycosyltransferase involved in cell wall biosynthesis
MKIGIDISQIVYGTGVSVYTKNLVENLLKVDKENEYVFFFASLRRKIPIFNFQFSNKFQIKSFKIPPTLLEILWNKFHILPIEKFIGEVDVFHSSDWAEPPAKKAIKVTTIHDLAVLRYPETFPPKIVQVHKRKLERVKKETRLIIAVSQSTKKDAVELLGIDPRKIRVIYEAVGEEFKPQNKNKIDEVKRKYGISGDYLLAFSGPQRKNLARIKEACRGFNLFVIGQPFVDHQDLPALYSGSLGLIYASLYEGFGLPILEAMACGCPVVTSNVSSMPEIAGKAAILVDPYSVQSISRGVKEVLKRREELKKLGFIQVKNFSWEKCAKETLKVYEEAGK